MTTAYIVVVTLALVPQILFSVLYWRWIPTWVNNPYGRLSQLSSWSLITILSLCLFAVSFGKDFSRETIRSIFVFGLLPLVAFGFLQLILLKKAVDSAKEEDEKESSK